MKKQAVLYSALAVTLVLTAGVRVCALAEVFNANQYYTWGISGDQLAIPDGSVITEAELTIHGLTSTDENTNDTLAVFVLDNPPLGFVSNVAAAGVDHFEGHGFRLVPDYHDSDDSGTEDLTYCFSTINDPNSWAWDIFKHPFKFELADSTSVDFTSSLLELIDYAGNSTPFGIGFTVAAETPALTWAEESYFDGEDHFIEISDSPALDIQNEITLSARIKLSSYSNDWPKLIIKPYQSTADPWELYCLDLGSNGNTPRMIITDGIPNGYGAVAVDSSCTLSLNEWYHIAGTYDGSQLSLYVNGNLIDTQPANFDIGTNDMPLAIGGRLGANSFNGFIDNVQIYDRALDSDEVLQLYRFDPNDTSGFSFRGVSLQLTVNAFKGDPYESVLTYSYGETNRPPVMENIPLIVEIEEGKLLTFPAIATDPDNDEITYSAMRMPNDASYVDGIFKWTPSYDLTTQNAVHYEIVSFIASDGNLIDSKTVLFKVKNTNRNPILNPIGSKTVSENEKLSFSVSGTDPDGDKVNIYIPYLPQGATFENNVFSWTPGFNQAGFYDVSIFAADEHITLFMEIVRITVNP